MAENFFGITDTGRQRNNNEDAFIAQSILNGQFIVACVIDGVGGYEGGEVAAAIARETILQALKTSPDNLLHTMQEAFASANERIYQERVASDKNSSMACVATLAVVDIKNNKFSYVHVGDTRLYLFRDHSLIKITKDQSFVGFLEDSGRLPEQEAMKHPKRNEINKALGFDRPAGFYNDYIETGESPFLPDDTILLCSDGLTDMVGSREISSVLLKRATLEQKGKELVAAANDAGGKDNITVVLVRNNKRPVKHEAAKPVLIKKKNIENVEVQQEEPAPVKTVPPSASSSKNGIILLLSILCLLFLGGMVWMWWQQNKRPGVQPALAEKGRNVQEIRLQTFINASPGDTVAFNDTPAGQTIYLTDTIWIRRDSLYLKGANLNLVKDSSFGKTVALVLGPECKNIVLDSLTFQGFDVAILAADANALQLKNVQFKNCSIPVGYRFDESIYVNGRFTSTPRSKKDSLPQRPKN